jgi:hypothetical protein
MLQVEEAQVNHGFVHATAEPAGCVTTAAGSSAAGKAALCTPPAISAIKLHTIRTCRPVPCPAYAISPSSSAPAASSAMRCSMNAEMHSASAEALQSNPVALMPFHLARRCPCTLCSP